MNASKPERLARRRLPVAELHPHLMCILCGGYYVDATTIIECLHSFCKSCLVRYLETNKYCPICEVQVHKTKPLLNIRPDETLQNMVYKLVPGLFHREMKYRQEFYAKHPEAPPSSPEDRGIVDPIECQFYAPEEQVSLSLEYKQDAVSNNNGVYKRYLRCPAAVTIAHLQKLVRNKYDLSPAHQIDVMFDDKILMPDISIMDVAYSFHKKRKEQFNFTYHILEAPCKKRKAEELKDEDPEQMDVDPPPPTLLSSLSSVPLKATSSPQPESKSKLDSIISRLGSAKKTENILKKDKNSDEWKEVQLQISERGIMTVTDISSLDKLINSIDKKNKQVSSEKANNQKVGVKKEENSSKPEENSAPSQDNVAKNVKPNNSNEKVDKSIEPTKKGEVTKAIEHKQDDPIKEVPSDRKDTEKKILKPDKSEQSTVTPAKTCLPSKGPAVVSSSQQNSSNAKVSSKVSSAPSLPMSSHSSVAPVSAVAVNVSTSISSKTCTTSAVTSQGSLGGLVVSAAPALTSSSGSTPVSKGITKPANTSTSALTITTVARTTPVPIAKPAPPAQPAKKSSSSPVGYKTLKCGPKNWNPTISRSSFLSSKADQQPQQQGSSSSTGSGQGGSGKPAAPAKFFKMRNTPRFLGNPASGVKAMYQIPESKPEAPPPAKSPSVMKLDPRTLTPIVSNAPSLTSKSSPTQPKARPPFPSTTLSAQVSNHSSSSRVVATTTTTSSSSSTKHSDLSSLRNSPTQPLVNPFPFSHNPFMPKGIPNFLYGPGLLPTNAQFASMLSPGLGYPPVTASGFHQGLPQPASLLFNSHTLHRQLNSSSPGSPTGYPTSLPSPSSMSLAPSPSSPSSKIYPAGQRTGSSSEKVVVTSSSHSSPSRSNRNNASVAGFGSQGSGKVNGLEPMKNSSANQVKTSLPSSEGSNFEGKAKASASKDAKTTTPSVSDNNNTLPVSTAKLPSEKQNAAKLPLDVSNLVSKESGKCSDEQLMNKPKPSTSTSVKAQSS